MALQHDPTAGVNGHPVRGALVRLADPELVAVDMIERLGPVACIAIATALLELAGEVAR